MATARTTSPRSSGTSGAPWPTSSSSSPTYLHRELRLSKGAAQNRKTAAELIQAFPEVEAALRAGELCLSTVNELARVLTPENRAEVLPRFYGLSRREAEAVAASLRPAEVVPSRVVVTAIRPAAPATAARATPLAASPPPTTLLVHPGEPRPAPVLPDEPPAPVVVSQPRSSGRCGGARVGGASGRSSRASAAAAGAASNTTT